MGAIGPATSHEEYTVGGVVAFFPMGVTEVCEVCFQLPGVALRHVDTREDAAVIGAVIAVMEQADIPIGADGIQKIE